MKKEDYRFFRENGYVSLGKILTDQEVVYYANLFDLDHAEKQDFWFDYGNYQTVNYDVSHPSIAVNLDSCIQCNLCVRACREVQVNDVIGFAKGGPLEN